jgi:hypothetical protein
MRLIRSFLFDALCALLWIAFAVCFVKAVRAAPAPRGIAITVTETGIDGEALADTPRSNAINMEAQYTCNQLSVTLAITPGSTTRVTLQCFEAGQGEGLQAIPFCVGGASSSCEPNIREFTLSKYTADASGVIWITSRWSITKRWAWCTVDDPDDSDGTVDMTGVRSWQ